MSRPAPTDTERCRRLRGDGGSGYVAGIAIVFAVTFGGLVWLARDVDRGISNRSAASSIAFQTARSGAQQASPRTLRDGGDPVVDVDAATRSANETAQRLLDAYGLSGTVQIDVGLSDVTAIVTVTDGGVTVTGRATVESQRAP